MARQKARFTETQEQVKIIQNGDTGLTTVFICLNGKKEKDKYGFDDENVATIDVWEYDYNEFIVNSEELDVLDVRNHPEKYLDFSPIDNKKLSLEERIDIIQERQEMVEQALQDFIVVALSQ